MHNLPAGDRANAFFMLTLKIQEGHVEVQWHRYW
jgi:hypothetical protein